MVYHLSEPSLSKYVITKIYPNDLYAHEMNRMKDETGNIMMLNLENAENVSFGFVNHDQSASKYD